ncbi:hypothetical protein AB3N02_21605 [Priestia aryabhattai]|uniref:hypothetical protein n=1 Tax=Priestia aryabhattai TaxID=412384 RepID=UPI0039A10BA6
MSGHTFEAVNIDINYPTVEQSKEDAIYLEVTPQFGSSSALTAITVPQARWLSQKLAEYADMFEPQKELDVEQLLEELPEEPEEVDPDAPTPYRLSQMDKQLNQVFKYAEMLQRVEGSLKLLSECGGYIGEFKIQNELQKTRDNIMANLKQHFENSDVSERALHTIMRIMSEVVAERDKTKYKVGDAWCGDYEYWEIVFIPNSDQTIHEVYYIIRDSGHSGIRYWTVSEGELTKDIKELSLERVVGN